MVKYLLAIDSAHATASIDFLARIYKVDHDSLVVISIGEFDSANALVLGEDAIIKLKKGLLNRSEKLVNGVLEVLQQRGITATGKVEIGNVRDLLVAETEHFDMTVLASSNPSMLRRLFIGSVCEHVMTFAKSSVLVIKESPHSTTTTASTSTDSSVPATTPTTTTEPPAGRKLAECAHSSSALETVSEFVAEQE